MVNMFIGYAELLEMLTQTVENSVHFKVFLDCTPKYRTVAPTEIGNTPSIHGTATYVTANTTTCYSP
jgi:hypothetical protein